MLAERNGIPMPKRSQYADEDSKLRGALLAMHELAAGDFPRQPATARPAKRARAYIAKRGVAPDTVEHFGLGYSDRSGRTLVRLFEQRDFSAAQMEIRPGRQAPGRQPLRPLPQPPDVSDPQRDRQGHRLRRARAHPPRRAQVSQLARDAASTRRATCCTTCTAPRKACARETASILVEGYMDVIGVCAAGFTKWWPVAAPRSPARRCSAVKRHSDRIVVNFDPDAAGANAAERSINMLLDEGMQVRISNSTAASIRTNTASSAAPRRITSASKPPRATSTGSPTAPARSTTCARPKARSRCSISCSQSATYHRPVGAHDHRQRRGGLYWRGPGYGARSFP